MVLYIVDYKTAPKSVERRRSNFSKCNSDKPFHYIFSKVELKQHQNFERVVEFKNWLYESIRFEQTKFCSVKLRALLSFTEETTYEGFEPTSNPPERTHYTLNYCT